MMRKEDRAVRDHMKLNKAAAFIMAVCSVLLVFITPVSAGFVNQPITAKIDFECVKVDQDYNGNYDIVIEKVDDNAPMPSETVISMAPGKGCFEIEIDEPGTFSYKIYERNGENKDIIYDTTVYYVTLFVTQDDTGVLDYKVILSKEGSVKPTEVTFVNRVAGAENNKDDSDKKEKGKDPVVATGAAPSALIPYALILILAGIVFFISAVRRGKEVSDV